MIDPEIQAYVDNAISSSQKDARFDTSNTIYHAHNGVDGPKISSLNLDKFPSNPSMGDVLTFSGTQGSWISVTPTSVGQALISQGTSATPIWSNAGQFIFGDGSDGAVTISSPTTLSRDMFYTTLTVATAGTLSPSAYRVFATTQIINNGTITFVGNAGSSGGTGGVASGIGSTGSGGAAGTAGTAIASGTIFGNIAGVAGGAGGQWATSGSDGNAGSSATISVLVGNGVNGGAGATNDQPAGAAGTGGTTTQITKLANASIAVEPYIASNFIKGSASGGSGGGGSGANHSSSNDASAGGGGGGGSGATGGFIALYSPIIRNTGTITVQGGAGGAGGAGGNADINSGLNRARAGSGGGGGAPGNGGIVLFVYRSALSQGTVVIAAGAQGSGGAGGVATNTGDAALVVQGVAGNVSSAGLSGTIATLIV